MPLKKEFIAALLLLCFLIPVNAWSETIKPIKNKKGEVIGRFVFTDEWIVEQNDYVYNVKLENNEIGFISVNPFNTLENEKAFQKSLAAEDGLEFHEQVKVSPKGIKYHYYTLTNPLNPSYIAEKYVADLGDAIISFNISQGKDNHYALDFINMIDTDKTVPLDYVEATTEEKKETTEKEKKQEDKPSGIESIVKSIQNFIYSFFSKSYFNKD